MPIYNITETKTAILKWDYTVFAENEDEALHKVQNGQVEAENFTTEEDPFGDSEFDVWEEDENKVAS